MTPLYALSGHSESSPVIGPFEYFQPCDWVKPMAAILEPKVGFVGVAWLRPLLCWWGHVTDD